MQYLSVCSGIEAASVAWSCLGWTPLAFSEIEPFPRAVLQHHYPDVPLHGDFTVLRDQPWIADADVLVGGTPCQAFSVAGLRKSLDDDRGNLSLEFVRLADAIDTVRSGRGREPGIIVWENVPGVLSVKDNAFGCFLAGLAGDVTPYVPPRGKWTNAGVVDGPQRTVAWRVLDAQYFGLAQRRRRVFVIASAREGFDPAAVLLEFEGLRRDSPPRREAGQAASGGASGRAGGGGVTEQLSDSLTVGANQTTGFSSPSVVGYSHWDDPNAPHPTLNQSHNTGGVGASNQELFSQRGAYLVGGVAMEDPVPPLMARSSRGGAQTLSPGHQTDGHMVAVPLWRAGDQANAETLVDMAGTLNCNKGQQGGILFDVVGDAAPCVAVEVCPTLRAGGNSTGGDRPPGTDVDTADSLIVTHYLRAEGFDASQDGTGRGTPLVPVVCATGEVTHALTAGGTRQNCTEDGTGRGTPLVPVPYSIMPQNSGKDYKAREVEVAQPIMAGGPVGGNQSGDYILQPVAYRTTGNDGVYETGDLVHALTTNTDPNSHVIGFSAKDHGADATLDLSPTLRAMPHHGSHANGGGQMGVAYAFQPSIARNGRGDMGDIVNALNAQSGETGKGDAAPCVAVGVDVYNQTITGQVSATLNAESGAPNHSGPKVMQHMAVRRLTPQECELLQGFPSYYTQIPWKKKPAADCPDGPRYKALGNSFAVPVVRWIGTRIARHLRGEI